MKIPYVCTLAAASLVAAIGSAAAAQVSETVTTRSAEAVDRVPGRAGTEAFWTQRPDVGVPAVVQTTYAKTREVLTNPTPVENPERFGRGGGFVGLDKFHSMSWRSRAEMASGDAS